MATIPRTGLIGSEQALQGGLTGALNALGGGVGQARADLQPFAGAGRGASDLQAALSGALGPEAQQQAFADFQSSPGQDFLTGQAEKSLLRNTAATGGLGGGNVLQALQEQAIGLAQQDFGNQFSRLGDVAGRGFQATGQQAGITGAGGQTAANLAFGTGQALAGGRTRAGEQIAGQVSDTTSALSDLVARQGSGVSDIVGGATGNIANILQTAGITQGQSNELLATLLANIATGQGTQASGLSSIPGVTNTQGSIQGIGQAAEGIGTLLSFF